MHVVEVDIMLQLEVLSSKRKRKLWLAIASLELDLLEQCSWSRYDQNMIMQLGKIKQKASIYYLIVSQVINYYHPVTKDKNF